MGTGKDILGLDGPVFKREWHKAADPIRKARDTMDTAFELSTKMGSDKLLPA
jgi:xylose isomerase